LKPACRWIYPPRSDDRRERAEYNYLKETKGLYGMETKGLHWTTAYEPKHARARYPHKVLYEATRDGPARQQLPERATARPNRKSEYGAAATARERPAIEASRTRFHHIKASMR